MATDGTAGGPDGYDQFIEDHGMRSMQHISDESHADLVAEAILEYDVTWMPTFVAVRSNGEFSSKSGWSERTTKRLMDWARE